MIKSTYKPKIVKKEVRLLMEKLKEFELAYYLGWSKLNLKMYRDPILEELVNMINRISKPEMLNQKTVLEKPKTKIKKLF